MEKPIPEEILRNFKNWKRLAITLRALFVVLAVGATMSSLAVTTFTQELGDIKCHGFTALKFCTFLSALSIGLLTSLDIAGKANRVRRAVRLLTGVLSRYQNEPDFSIEAVIKAYELGEEIVGDVNYIPQNTNSSEQPDEVSKAVGRKQKPKKARRKTK